MALPTNNSRPALPYNPLQVLPNHNRYSALGKFPPTAQQLDGDFNALVDLVNTLAGAINDTAVGIFPGADNPLNAQKLPTTDGQGNVSWTNVTPLHLTDNAVHTRHIEDAAITPGKIQAQAVGTNQIADGAVATPKILDNAVTAPKVADGAVTTAKVADNAIITQKVSDNAITTAKVSNNAVTTEKVIDNAITTPKVANNAITNQKVADNAISTTKVSNNAITPPKISSTGAQLGDVLTADGKGAASFLANKGKVLQIISYEDKGFVRNEYDAEATPKTLKSFKTAPFLLRITPLKTGSKILIFYSINVGSYVNQYAGVTFCKNGLPFKIGVDDTPNSYWGVTHNIYNSKGQPHSCGQYGCFNFSSLFVDGGTTMGQQISYEIKKAHAYTGINSGYNGGYTTVSVMHAIEIDI
jgi:hypothetical protein